MYGLPQSGSSGHELLEEQLNKEGNFQNKNVPGFWKHQTCTLQFVLVVNDFGIKYIKKMDLNHLIDTLKKHCKVSADLEEKNTSNQLRLRL